MAEVVPVRRVTFDSRPPQTIVYSKTDESITSDLQRLLESYEAILNSKLNSIVLGFIGIEKLSFDAIDEGKKEKILRYIDSRIGLHEHLSQIYNNVYEDFWVKIFWPLLINHGNETVHFLIVDIFYSILLADGAGIGNNKTKIINMTVAVLLKLAYPTFKYICKNQCSSINEATYPHATEKCNQILNRLRRLTIKPNKQLLTMFDNHIAFTFGCSLRGVQQAYQPYCTYAIKRSDNE